MKRNPSTRPEASRAGSKVKAAAKGTRGLAGSAQNGATKTNSSKKPLARYITKEMVLKVAGMDAPIEVTKVNLTLNKEGGKKIQFIENLEPFTRIQVLSLAYNQIAKIEHLDRLTKIRDLDLSCNCISKIEGLEMLVNLQRLNLSDNLIEIIPAWFGKKLRALRVFHITGNMLFSEIENLGGQLEREEKKLRNLEADHNKSVEEAKKTEGKLTDMKKKQTDDRKHIKALEDELQAKDDLLKRKTAELTKACEKHYKLEQELAFHKIDAKFEPLGYFPDTLEIEEGGTEESAYIGRASYKRNQYAGEHYVLPGSHSKRITKMGGNHMDSRYVNPEIQQQMHGVLDDQLATKQKQIARAQEKLSHLQDQLDRTESRIQDANEELDRVSRAQPRAPLSEEEKQELQRQLLSKVQVVNELRGRIAQIEDGMHRTLDVIQEKDEEMKRLKKQLAQMRQGEPGYAEAHAAIAEKEEQVGEADREYSDLQKDLADSLDLLEQEMKKVKRLQRQLNDGEVEVNDALKQELEDVVDGLTDYLGKVQEQQAQQQREADALKKERDNLLQRLREAEAEKQRVPVDELEAMQSRLNDSEAILKDLEDENESLRRGQAEASIGGADKDIQLQEAEEEVERLKDALKEQQRQTQAERDALQKQLAAERRRLEGAARKARAMGDKEQETKHMAGQLAGLQAENEMLAARLQNQDAEMEDLMNASLNPEDVAGRIQQAGRNIQRGVGKRTRPSDGGDVVGLSLADLEGKIGDRLKQSQREKDKAQRQKEEADAEIQALRDQLADMQQKYAQAATEAKEEADRMAEEEAEMEDMRDEVRKLQEKLRRAQRQPQERRQPEPLPVRDPQEERLKQLEKSMRDAERQMKDNDQLAAQELAAAEAQIQQLRDELSRPEDREEARQRRETERQRQSALAEAEALASAQAQQAAEELARAQDEIDGLERALANKDKHLRDEMQQSGMASQTIADQQEEIGALYDTLEEQKGEILRLNDMLNRLTGGSQGPASPDVNSDLQNLMREIGELRDAIHHHGNSMGNIGSARELSRSQLQHPPNVTSQPPPVTTGYHPTSHGRFFATSPYPESPGRFYSPPQGMQTGNTVPLPGFGSQTATQQPPLIYSSQPATQQPPTQTSHVFPPTTQQPVAGHVTTIYPPQPSVPHSPHIRPVPDAQHGASRVPVTETLSGNRMAQTETPRRGRLKRVKPSHGELFCNVPEHHDLEDELARLEKLLEKKKKRRSSTGAAERLEAAMLQRREELDGLDLAVERQRKRLKQLREQDEDLQQEKSQTLRQLDELKKTADEQAKLVRRRAFLDGMAAVYPEEEDYNDLEITMRGDELEDEIHCLEKTLAKRRAELREADRLLQECTGDLREAQVKARETLAQYDKTCTNLQRTSEDAEEMEKRVSDTAHHLVDAEEQLANLRASIHDLEEERVEKQRRLSDVERIVISRDAEYRTLETKAEQAATRLQQLQAELIAGEQRESAQLIEVREREKLLTGRKTELDKVQDQIEHQQQKLSHLNREIGEKQSELQTMTSDIDRNRRELVSALREGEGEISETQQRMKEAKGHLEELQSQKRDLTSAVSDKRSELASIRNDVEQEESALRQLQSSMDKQQADLKHTLEMIQLEKTELEALKLQHDNKMADLEKTQLAALEGKANLEKLQTDSQHLQAEVERTKQLLENQRDDKRRLEQEKRTLEESVKVMEKERDVLKGNCLALESKLGQLKRRHQNSTEDIEHRSVKLQQLDQGLSGALKELEDTNSKKNTAKKELVAIKNQLKENKSKFKTLREQLEEIEEQKHLLEQEVSDREQQKSEVESRLQELQSAVQQAHHSLAESTAQERRRQDILHQLEAEIEERRLEVDEKRQALEQAQAEVDREEAKLSRLIGALTVEAEGIKGEVAAKRQELERIRVQVSVMDRELEDKEVAVQRLTQVQGDINQLRGDLKERDEEKTRLAEALNFSHSELDALRNEKHRYEKKIAELRKDVEQAKEKLKKKQIDHESDREKLMLEMHSLSEAAEEHSSRADRLSRELNSVREQYIKLQLQLNSQSGANSRDQKMTASLEQLRPEIKSEVSHGLKDLEMSRLEVLDELQELHEQKAELTRQLHLLHTNLQGARLEAEVDRDREYLRDLSISQDKSWRKEERQHQLEQEQDQLKLQIQQRMSRQARVLDGVKQKSQTTLHNLKRKLQNLEDLVNSNSRSRTELEDELDVNLVFQSTLASSGAQGRESGDSGFKSYSSSNHRTEQPEPDVYSTRQRQMDKDASEKAPPTLAANQSDSMTAMGDAYSFPKSQPESDKPIRGILKRSYTTTDDPPSSFRLRRSGSFSEDLLASRRPGRSSPPEMPSVQTRGNLPSYTHQPPSSPSHSYSNQRHSRRSPSPNRPERDTQNAERDSRMQDFMNSIKRLKEEKLAEIERVSKQTS